MEFVDGTSLQKYIARRRLSMEEILEVAIQVSDGLAEAHNQGIIHGDIKPSNILMNTRGRAKIVDFGLATVLRAGGSGTRSNIYGTAGYMSPEQILGGVVDTRSDLFSFGVVLYEIITGKAPFTRETLGDTLRATQDTDPMSEYSSVVPLELQRIVTRLMNKDKDRRYQHADDLRSELRYTLEAVVSGRVRYPGQETRLRSMAVLPFVNLSADKEQDYFCDGMAEEIANALAKIRGLRVAARTSAFAFKNTDEDVRQIGHKLHVDSLLEGSVRRSGDRLRVTVQLTDVATGYHLWSERFDREMEDVFAIQDEIAENVVRAMQVILSDEGKQPVSRLQTSDTQAYDYYLRGREYFHQGRRKSLQYALEMFQRATAIDPSYSLAYVGIAECCGMLIHYYAESRDIHHNAADRASLRALELDPGLPQAHAARGLVLWVMDRFDEAAAEFEKALELDPDQGRASYYFARACFQRGEFERAVRLFEDACRGQENFEARYFAAQTYSALNKTEEALVAYRLALREIERHVELHPDDARAYTMGAVSLIRVGERRAGLEWATRALEIDPGDARIQYNVACLFALEGETTRAFECLEAAVKAGFAHREWVEKDPDLDSLRDDPRFQALKWRG
jgi:TolB-like protein/Flp pilus assembly protein TadD